jgi:orotidine-5'-phosphate decarboxylase
MKENPLIIALDVESAGQARELVLRIGDAAEFYKVGIELYAAAGIDFVGELIDLGKQVFLDLKYYDIGETVKRAVAQVARHGVRFLSVHASSSVMRAAVEGRSGTGLQILAVTVLTSLDKSDLRDDLHTCSVEELVARRVRNAIASGVDGLVCSPLEVAKVREAAGRGAVLVTPGVRSAGAAAGDQKRVATPREAIANGADYLVIGRQVTRASDPRAEVERVLAEVSGAASENRRAAPPPFAS